VAVQTYAHYRLLAADVDGSVKCCCMFNASDIDDGDNIVDNTATAAR